MSKQFLFLPLLVFIFTLGFTQAYTAPQGESFTYLPLTLRTDIPLPEENFALITYPVPGEGSQYEIGRVSADGSNLLRLTNNPDDDIQPQPSPNSQTIWFLKRPGSPFTMHADGTVQQPIVGDALIQWSPDSTATAYSTFDGKLGIGVTELDTRTAITVTTGVDSIPFYWTPDSSALVFVAIRNGQSDIYRINRDGSGEVPVYTSPSNERLYGVLPDSRILFGIPANSGSTVWIVDADGTNPRLLLTTAADTDDIFLEFDPTGRWIYPRFAGTFTEDRTLRLYSVEGGVVWELDDLCIVAQPSYICRTRDVSWSADGSNLYFDIFREIGGGDAESLIYQIRTDGSESSARLVVTDAKKPALSPNGRTLAYERNLQNSSDEAVHLRDLQSGTESVISSPLNSVNFWGWLTP